MCVVLLPNVFHTNDMFALSEKSAEKKTKTGRLPIAHYKQKPAGSDLWPVNRCIPRRNTVMLLRDAKMFCGSCLELFLVGEIEQKQVMWCLKSKSLNINLVY